MTTLDDLIKQQQSLDLVQLKIDGSKTAVNTIVEQQTTRGVSLVCPFPSLEVDVPVNFGKKDDGTNQRGTIHRIGVENDPESGLPRLRLSVRSVDSSCEIPVELEGFGPSAPRETTVAGAPTDVDFWSISDEQIVESISKPEFSAVTRICEEPAWTDSHQELPSPEEILNRARTRRKHRLSGGIAWAVVCMMIGAGGYLIYHSRESMAGKVKNAMAMVQGITQEVEATPEVATDEPIPAEPIAAEPIAAEPIEGESIEETVDTPEEEAGEMLASAEAAVEEVIDELVEETVEPMISNEEVRVLLPTRWKPEYSTSYRVRNPHGVVVDVPGALVKREGWIDVPGENGMIRSVKAVQRETGARFIVYVNGDLPRFMTSPRSEGVSLKLYREREVEIGQTEQVAVAR